MEILILVSLFAVALACGATGAVVAEWRSRSSLTADLTKEREELKTLLEDIQSVHNEMATKFAAIEDKVTAHEFQIKANAPRGGPFAAMRQ